MGKGFKGELLPSERKGLAFLVAPTAFLFPDQWALSQWDRDQCFVLESRSHVVHLALDSWSFCLHPLPRYWDSQACIRVPGVLGIEFVCAKQRFYQLSYTSNKDRVLEGILQFSISHKYNSYLFRTYYAPSKLSYTFLTAKWMLCGYYYPKLD